MSRNVLSAANPQGWAIRYWSSSTPVGLLLDLVLQVKHNRSMIKMLDNKWMTIEEATESIGCTRSYVCYLLRSDKLKGKKLTERAWLVDVKSVNKFKAEPKKTGRPRKNGENN
jgi:hypothetical protein